MGRPRDGQLVVVTHHAPHPVYLPPAQRIGWAEGHAASDLSPLTDAGQAALWSMATFMVRSTSLAPGEPASCAMLPGLGSPTWRSGIIGSWRFNAASYSRRLASRTTSIAPADQPFAA
jgi:hypothetical protein